MLGAYRVTGPIEKPDGIQKWIFDNIYSTIARPVAPLMYAISFILLWLLFDVAAV